MNNRSNGSVSFNTIKRSHRAERSQRNRQGRVVLLAICAVLLLLALTGLVFLVVHIAHVAGGEKQPLPNDPVPNGTQSTGNILYTSVAMEFGETQTGDLILVNKTHAYTFPDTRLENLNGIDKQPYIMNNYRVPSGSQLPYMLALDKELIIQPHAAQALNSMLVSYYQTTGDNSLTVREIYRTEAQQNSSSVPAGYSDHHTALLVCLKVLSSSTYKDLNEIEQSWVFENCHKFGFIQRYPSAWSGLTEVDGYPEAFRYVGVAHATYIKKNQLCLEKYLELLRTNHTSLNGTDGKHLSVDTDGNGTADYEIYYVPANSEQGALTAVPVPSNFAYSISGDNCGGFIVTVDLANPIA